MRQRLGILAAVLSLALATPALAGHHLWDITEIYSNGDGSVQFVELFTADNNEQGVGPFNVTASGNTDFRHMIRAGGSKIIVSRSTSGSNTVIYVTSDHLGSNSAVTRLPLTAVTLP